MTFNYDEEYKKASERLEKNTELLRLKELSEKSGVCFFRLKKILKGRTSPTRKEKIALSEYM